MARGICPALPSCVRVVFSFSFCFHLFTSFSTTYKSVTIALLVRIPCLGPWMGFFSIRRTMLNPLGSARRKISDWAYSSPDLQGYVRFFNTPTRDWGTRIILILFQAWSLIFNFQVQNMERPYRFSYNNCSFLMFIPYWSQLTIGYHYSPFPRLIYTISACSLMILIVLCSVWYRRMHQLHLLCLKHTFS